MHRSMKLYSSYNLTHADNTATKLYVTHICLADETCMCMCVSMILYCLITITEITEITTQPIAYFP